MEVCKKMKSPLIQVKAATKATLSRVPVFPINDSCLEINIRYYFAIDICSINEICQKPFKMNQYLVTNSRPSSA